MKHLISKIMNENQIAALDAFLASDDDGLELDFTTAKLDKSSPNNTLAMVKSTDGRLASVWRKDSNGQANAEYDQLMALAKQAKETNTPVQAWPNDDYQDIGTEILLKSGTARRSTADRYANASA